MGACAYAGEELIGRTQPLKMGVSPDARFSGLWSNAISSQASSTQAMAVIENDWN
jgi:hypothetical protein